MRIKSLLFSFFLFGFAASLQAAPPQSKWAKLDGNKIHYYDIGNAKSDKALVLIHGWTCSADFWKDNYNDFSGYRVIAVDLPGHGKSDKPRLAYSMEHFAKAVNAVMKNAGVKRGVLVGHSMGTPVARQYYRLYPKNVLGIVIVDGPLRPIAPKADMEKFLAPMRANYKDATSGFIDGMVRTVTDKSLVTFIKENMQATPEYVAMSAMEGMADEGIWGADKISVPVLAVMAPLAANWPPGVKEAYIEMAPNIDFQEWTGVGHFLHMEKPKEFNEAVRTFVIKNKLL